MAQSVNFDQFADHLEEDMESPVDEAAVHDSFSHLIEEQALGFPGDFDALQMDPLDLDDEARDDVGYLGYPGQRPEERYQQGHPHVDQRGHPHVEQRGHPHVDQWSSATLRILSSMPSRTIGRSRGAIISQYYNRTMQLRRRKQSRPSIRDFSRSSRPSIRGYGGVDSDLGDFTEEETKRERLVNNLQNLSASDRVRMLRAMPLSVSEKTEFRQETFRPERSYSRSNLPCCSQCKDSLIIVARQTWYSCLSLLSSLQLWHTALKTVSGRFGTGVLSYFVFLRTLLFFNIFLFSVTGLFLVLPQAVFSSGLNSTTGPSGLELLTGGGCFTESVMFYGYYTNATLKEHCVQKEPNSSTVHQMGCHGRLYYNMPLAYFFTIGAAFLFTCIILVYTMKKLFGQSFRIDKSQSILAMKVFCSWDFKVMKKTSVKLQSENISTQLKELLAEVGRKKEKVPIPQKLAWISMNVLGWSLCLGSTLACVVAVHYFSEYMHKDLQLRARNSNPSESPLVKEASLLALPVVVSSINLLLPGFFNTVASVEKYDSPSMRTYVAISRNLMLKVSVLGILCFHWLGRIAADPQSLKLKCWETFVGQELYRFLVMDFIFTILDTFFGEFLWRLFSQKLLRRKRKPVFDIARNVLELIYGQTLAWMGVLFTPLLPAVQILKLLCLFYMKKTSLMMNCQVPRKPWHASHMTTVFITLLCFPSFLGAAVCVTLTMWSIKPSQSCGPFRGLQTMIQSGKHWVKQLESTNSNLAWLSWVHTYLVENPVVFIFFMVMIFVIVIYFHTQVVDGQRKIITLLQDQIENEGEDKKFLITRLQAIHEQNRPSSSQRIRGTSEDSSDY
ncbi:transmembrane channel-like protein 6b isoform X2 [Clupea harengus]|uniref:Transmembrane channel-like protein n=1 Tax=Clupea harengus TaxID=7950 RepID=A0A6P8G569_CLUHA|nr:transmembrane channel-like protein 6b isoform X2 [Clupea harengus]